MSSKSVLIPCKFLTKIEVFLRNETLCSCIESQSCSRCEILKELSSFPTDCKEIAFFNEIAPILNDFDEDGFL